MFDQDKVDLLKADGTKIEGITSTISGSNLIVVKLNRNQGNPLVIAPTDLLQRKLSNGVEETFEVLDPVFYERGPGSTGPHYQVKVRKMGLPEAKAAVQNITYNLSGPNSRVNIDSVDNSVNTVSIHSEVNNYLEELRKEVSALDLSPEAKAEALEVVDEVKGQFESGKPKRSVVSALLSSLPHVASVLKIAAAITTFL